MLIHYVYINYRGNGTHQGILYGLNKLTIFHCNWNGSIEKTTNIILYALNSKVKIQKIRNEIEKQTNKTIKNNLKLKPNF